MFNEIKRWYRDNRIPFQTLFFASAGIGFLLMLSCLFFPPVLPAIATLFIGGGTPLAFLLSLSLPIAALTTGLLTTGFMWVASALTWFVTQQIWSISKATYAACAPKEEVITPTLSKDTPTYIKEYLQKKKVPFPYEENEEDEDLEIYAKALEAKVERDKKEEVLVVESGWLEEPRLTPRFM